MRHLILLVSIILALSGCTSAPNAVYAPIVPNPEPVHQFHHHRDVRQPTPLTPSFPPSVLVPGSQKNDKVKSDLNEIIDDLQTARDKAQ